VCGIPAVNRANCVWDCCFTGNKLGVEVLLYREQIGCGIAAVREQHVLEYCFKSSRLVMGLQL